MRTVADTFHLHNRQGTWYYRRRVPDHLQPVIGRKFLQHSLGTTSKAEAKKRRTVEDLKADALFKAAESGSGGHAPAGFSAKGHVSLATLTQYVQAFVERDDQRSKNEGLNDPPTNEEELHAERMDIGDELAILTTPGDPRRDEQIFHAGSRALREAGADWTGNADIDAQVAGVVERALMELLRRRQARQDKNFDRAFFDELYNPARPPTVTFGELADQYLKEKTEEGAHKGLTRKRLDKIAAHLALIREIIGEDTPVHAVDYDVCKRVQSLLASMPSNRTKLYPSLDLEQSIKRSAAEGKPTLSALTQNQYLETFRDALRLGLRKKLVSHNPVDGMHALTPDKFADSERRRSWSPDQIKAFFTSEFYCRCAPGAEIPYEKADREWRFWLPLICLFTGMRPKEVCQLLISDVRQTPNGTWYFDITTLEDGEGAAASKSLKTAASRRRVPVHPELMRIGILDFTERRRKAAKANQRLLPGLKVDGYGDPARYALKRFRDSFIPTAIKLEERQTFYSLRHNFRDALRRCQAPAETLQAVGGWSQGKLVSDDYGDKGNPDLQQLWIEKVSYPGLDLAFLHVSEAAPVKW